MGLFDNAKTVMINNKEVQSITTLDGGVLYEKSGSGCVPDDILISATKDVLSYYDMEYSVLTATVVDVNSQPCSGKTVVFKNGNTVLSTQTTDSNGQCTYTYASSGAADVTITIECMSLIQTYVIEDCIRYNPTEETLDTSTRTVCEITSNTPNYICSFDYYPTDTWEWLRVYVGSMPNIVLSSSYDKSGNFGLTNLGYNKWVSVIFRVENGTLTVSAANKTASESITVSYPYNISYYPNRNNNRIKNLKVKSL